MRILLVEDDPRTARALGRGLREEGYLVDVASSGEEGEELARVHDYNVIVLDWYLPERDGLTVCRDLRSRGTVTPILMLTARDAPADRVRGLDSGADDYLTKPFAFDELLARLRALLRRSELVRPTLLSVADLTLDPVSHRVTRAGVPIDVTVKEYQILEVLLRRLGQVVSRAQLQAQVWGDAGESSTNAVDVHISHLRRKIDQGHPVALIHTGRARGYSVAAPEA